MKWTRKETPVKRYYDDIYDQLKSHLAAFVNAYNIAKRPKPLKGLTFMDSSNPSQSGAK